MKTFKDLKFVPHPAGIGITAQEFFPNGYGVSVIQGHLFYTDTDREWELAVIRGTPDSWEIDYTTPITDDVIGHLTEDEVTAIMAQVQQLPKQ